jgi:hypothetical protein
LEILQVLLQFKTVLTEVCLENKQKAWLLRYLLEEPMLLAFHSHTTYQWTSFYWIGSSELDVGSEAVWSNWLFNYWHLSCSSTWSCMRFYFIRRYLDFSSHGWTDGKVGQPPASWHPRDRSRWDGITRHFSCNCKITYGCGTSGWRGFLKSQRNMVVGFSYLGIVNSHWYSQSTAKGAIEI